MDLKVLLVIMFVLVCTIESKAVNKDKNKIKKGKKGRGRKLDSIAEINKKLGKILFSSC